MFRFREGQEIHERGSGTNRFEQLRGLIEPNVNLGRKKEQDHIRLLRLHAMGVDEALSYREGGLFNDLGEWQEI